MLTVLRLVLSWALMIYMVAILAYGVILASVAKREKFVKIPRYYILLCCMAKDEYVSVRDTVEMCMVMDNVNTTDKDRVIRRLKK